jgi:hypothetical protein
MPDRLGRVTIALNNRDVTITGDARQALMARLYEANIPPRYLAQGETSDGVLRDFAAVGATRPVELRKAQRVLLLRILERWVEEGEWSVDPDPRIPAELVALRDAIVADLHDGEQRQQ